MTLDSRLFVIARAMRHRNLRIYASGNAISLIGTWTQKLAIGWLAWELTHSGARLGILAFADLFPTVVAAPYSGVLADRHDRLKVVKITQSAAMVQALLLFGASISGVLNIWLLLALTLALGVVSALDQPARLALVPALVRREDISVAVSVNSILVNLARFIGPTIGGAMIYWFGVSEAFALNALSFGGFLIGLMRLRIVPAARGNTQHLPFRRSFVEGLRYTAGNPGLQIMLVLLGTMCFTARPLIDLMPGFASRAFDTGPNGLAALTASIGIGAIAGGISVNASSSGRRLTSALFSSVSVLALGGIAFVATDRLWVALPTLLAVGFGMARISINVQSTIHLATDIAMRGRVLSVYGMIVRGSPALGALAMGTASHWLGLRWPVFAGMLLLIAAGFWAFSRRQHIDESMAASETSEE